MSKASTLSQTVHFIPHSLIGNDIKYLFELDDIIVEWSEVDYMYAFPPNVHPVSFQDFSDSVLRTIGEGIPYVLVDRMTIKNEAWAFLIIYQQMEP
jgi:hypothetical protein